MKTKNQEERMTLFTDKRPFTVILIFLVMVLFLVAEPLARVLEKGSKAQSPHSRLIQKKTGPTREETTPTRAQEILQCDAQSAVLMDGLSGEILFAQNPNLIIPPASFVKILTLYLVFDTLRAGQLKMDEMVTVSEKAWRSAYKTDSSAMYLKVGERVKVEDLIKGVAIASGNDACIALAEHLAGSEEAFVLKMNEKAKAIGMKDSQFKNSHGLPAEGQFVTALDMALLAKRYIEDHPQALLIHSTKEFEYNGIKQGNRNLLLYKDIGVDGLKTGYIKESGYHLLATAKRDGQRMIAVVMGCDKVKKRAPEAQKLLEYGFKNFSTVEVVKKEAPFGPLKVKRGKTDRLDLLSSENAYVTVPRGKENLASVVPQLPGFVMAPVQKGQVLGKLLVQKEGKTLKEIDLYASSEIQKSLIPPWPYLLAGFLGLTLLCAIGLLFFRKSPHKRL